MRLYFQLGHTPEKESFIDIDRGVSALVLRFFSVRGGELKCRVTDVQNRHSWLIAEPDELHALLMRLQIRDFDPGKEE